MNPEPEPLQQDPAAASAPSDAAAASVPSESQYSVCVDAIQMNWPWVPWVVSRLNSSEVRL